MKNIKDMTEEEKDFEIIQSRDALRVCREEIYRLQMLLDAVEELQDRIELAKNIEVA